MTKRKSTEFRWLSFYSYPFYDWFFDGDYVYSAALAQILGVISKRGFEIRVGSTLVIRLYQKEWPRGVEPVVILFGKYNQNKFEHCHRGIKFGRALHAVDHWVQALPAGNHDQNWFSCSNLIPWYGSDMPTLAAWYFCNAKVILMLYSFSDIIFAPKLAKQISLGVSRISLQSNITRQRRI